MDKAEASLDQFGDSFNLGLFGDSFNLGLFADSVNLGTSKVHGLRRTNHRLRKSFFDTLDCTPSGVDHAEAYFNLFGDSFNLDTR
jgi:hypothetical protein